jgi:purine-binding chemotaxis protein CheW
MPKDLHIVGFRVGTETFGVPISLVHEIVRVPQITAVPDLRKRFGETTITSHKKNRILVAEIEGKMVGLIVDAASEVLKIPPSEVEAPPNVFDEGDVNYVTGVGKLKGRLIIMIDMAKILQRGELRRVGSFIDAETMASV